MTTEAEKVPLTTTDNPIKAQAEGDSFCESGSSPPPLVLPRYTDEQHLRIRWWKMKKGRWGDNAHDFTLDPATVLDHELREVGHDYWSEGPDRCPALAPPEDGVCHEDLALARKILDLRDSEGRPLVEVVGAGRLRELGWQVSEDAIGMVFWWKTIIQTPVCVEGCDEDDCDHHREEDLVERTHQVKLLNGTWGKYVQRPGVTPDHLGLAGHYEWQDAPRPPQGKYVWHRKSVGACAWTDFGSGDDTAPVLITEGFKKGAVAAALGFRVIALASVTQGGTGKKGKVQDLVSGGHGRYEIDGLVASTVLNRRVVWAFDADIMAKDPVRRSLAASMASLNTQVGANPEFVIFPETGKVKGALDSVLLSNKDKDPMTLLSGMTVSLGSPDSCSGWLKGPSAPGIMAIAWEYFRELRYRVAGSKPADVLLKDWTNKCVPPETATELLKPYDPAALEIDRRNRLQAHLSENYVLVGIGPEASSTMLRDGERLVKPVPNDKPEQAMARSCYRWWWSELGHEPETIKYADDIKRFNYRQDPQPVSPISKSDETELTYWVMPDSEEGEFPNTNLILNRLQELDEEGVQVPLTPESRDATLALVGGIFCQQASRQVAVCCGGGGNGKGTFARLVASAFGGFEGAHSVAYSVGDNTFANHPHWAVPLQGKYFCAIMETKRTRILEDERLRSLTGGDPLPVNLKGGAQYNAKNTTRWWINSNHTMEITGKRADLSRVFPLLFGDREEGNVTDTDFEAKVLKELPQFMYACEEAYNRICPNRGDVPLTPGLNRLRDQMVAAGEADMEAFADKVLTFRDGAVLRGTDLTTVIEDYSPRAWERTMKNRFREYVSRRSGGNQRTLRVPGQASTFTGWKGVELKVDYDPSVSGFEKAMRRR